MPGQLTVPGTTGELRDRRRAPSAGDASPMHVRGKRQTAQAPLGWLGRQESRPQVRGVAGEGDVVDGEPTPRPVEYPAAGHHPELAEVRWRQGGSPGCRLAAVV